METVKWKVEGMTCANCALTINKYLDKKGMQNIRVNPIDAEVTFETINGTEKRTLIKGINDLGYNVIDQQQDKVTKRPFSPTNEIVYFFACPLLWY